MLALKSLQRAPFTLINDTLSNHQCSQQRPMLGPEKKRLGFQLEQPPLYLRTMAESFPDHSDARVRAVLQYLCKDPKVAKEADKAFKILAAHDDDEAQRQAHDGQASLVPSAGNSEAHQSARGGEGEGENAPLVIVKKRKVGDANGPAVADDGAHTGPARIENPAAKICVYCSTAFTAETNHNRACRSHDGT